MEYTHNTDIVLDFFSGSGSTAHAVMNQSIKDGKRRQWIMVQLPEELNPKKEKDLIEEGYRTICDLGQERIRRAGLKIKETNPLYDLDYGFKVYQLKEE